MRLGAISDDFTGGLELASMLVARGVDCGLVTDPAAVAGVDGADALVAALKIRTAPVADAVSKADEAADALLAAGARRLFYKYCATFDSTDAGNIGPVTDRLAARMNAAMVTFTPSFPEVERTVYQGHLFVGSRLVSDSTKRLDPLTPMTDPDLVAVLSRQTDAKVGLIPLEIVAKGASRICERLAELESEGVSRAIVDAVFPADLQAIAGGVASAPLATGGSSVADYFPFCWRREGWAPRDAIALPPVARGRGAVIAGSCSERTLAQLAAFEARHSVIRLDLEAEPASAIAAMERQLLSLAGRGPVAVSTSARPDVVAEKQRKFGVHGAAHRAEAVLSAAAVSLRDHGFTKFVVAGGETSGAVVSALGVRRMHVGPYRGPGVSVAVDADSARLGFCLKSGKLGPLDMFEAMLTEMEA